MRALALTLVCALVAPFHAAASPAGVLWGVDNAGGPFNLHELPWAEKLLDEFQFDLWVQHYWPRKETAANRAHIRAIDAWCAARDIQWVANLEHANWAQHFIDEHGNDWFRRDDGRHFFLFPDTLLEEFGGAERLLGLMYDEAEHMQMCANMISEAHRPFMYDPAGDILAEAGDAFVEAASEVARRHRRHGVRLYTEHVFPVLFHGFARAGFNAGTKLLKEGWSPVHTACAMGAALQYETPLWLTPDLWGLSDYPGHTVEEYRSALLFAYHMGADCIYTENLAYKGAGENEGACSLICVEGDAYTVTPYGDVAKWFISEYVPAHPRRHTFRDARPRTAIVRQPDTCWGQGGTWYPDTLFGHPDWKPNETTRAWVSLWHLLTRGTVPAESLTWFGPGYKGRPLQFACPVDGVVVYDHHVGYDLLQGLEAILLTGLGVSEGTRDAVARSVREGALCVALPHLLPDGVREKMGEDNTLPEGDGVWIRAADFLDPHVRDAVAPLLPEPGHIRYRFGDGTVEFFIDLDDPHKTLREVRVNGDVTWTRP